MRDLVLEDAEDPPAKPNVARCTSTCIHTRMSHVLLGCVYIYIYIHTYIHAYIHTNIHTCMHTYIHTYIHAYVCICIRICTCRCTCMYVYVCVYIYIYIYIYVYTHMRIHINHISPWAPSRMLPRTLQRKAIDRRPSERSTYSMLNLIIYDILYNMSLYYIVCCYATNTTI